MKTRDDYNKELWARGEWDMEPDRVDFRHVGLDCFMLRNHSGVWCGYVGVPSNHPAFERDYDKSIVENIDVHGGLTYSGYHSYAAIDGLWWFGFDCNHHMDLAPLSYFHVPTDGETYKNLDYVRDEVKRLAEQLSKLTS